MRQLVWLVPALMGIIIGCGSIGTGERTIIRHHTTSNLQVQYFPYLTTKENGVGDRVRIYSGGGQATWISQFEWFRSWCYDNFISYMGNKYGGRADFRAAQLSMIARDLGTIPMHSPELTLETRKAIAKIHTDSTLSKEARTERAQSLANAFLNAPDTAYSTTLKGYDGSGREIYHYFPRIQVDFSADLLSDSNLDRFSQLAMLILIHESDFKKGVRFLDFSPKGADIAEFTRGQLTQQSQLTAKATAAAAEPFTKGVSLGAEISYTATETFSRELKDALEKRTVGIVENGRGFLAQLRAIKQLRIGGTYTFDLMLEIPSTPTNTSRQGYYEAVPAVKAINAETILLAVVRHVHDRGMTGWISRLPETENDDVYEQVVVEDAQNVGIWEFNNTPWVRYDATQVPTFTAKVITNRKDAQFAILDATGQLLIQGSGEKADLSIPNNRGNPLQGQLIFFPIVNTPAQGNAMNLQPNPRTFPIQVPAGRNMGQTFATTYTAP